MTERASFLTLLTHRLGALRPDGVVRMAITGVDGAGKTRLADDLAAHLHAVGIACIRISIDGFHNPRSLRYRLGSQSPEGFYRDSFNLDEFKRLVLDPLSPGGDMRYREAIFDHRTDRAVTSEPKQASAPAALIVDGIFLLMHELSGYWDLSVLLDVEFEQSFQRMALRDGCPPDPLAEENRRYREGQMLYIAECRPQDRADLVVEYSEFDRPQIVADRAR